MASKPGDNSTSLVTFKVYSEGSAVEDSIEFVSITVTKEVNRIGSATLEIVAGDMPDQDFPISNKGTFKPGTAIKVEAGYESENDTIYEGIVMSHGLRISGAGSLLVIECRDYAIKATAGRKNAVYEKKKDSEVISAIAGAYSDLTVSVDETTYQHEELIQYYCTDWDFILSRADVSGMIVISDDKNFSIKKPGVAKSAVLTVTYGDDLLNFDGEVVSSDQYSAAQAVAWDPATQKVVTSDGAKPTLNEQGNLTQTNLSDTIGLETYILQCGVTAETAPLKSWADALLLKFGLSRFRGSLEFQGHSSAKPGCIIEVAGLGDRFNGNVFVGKVVHTIRDGDWVTTAGLGIDPAPITEQENVMSPPASGLLPGIDGLQIGKVAKLDGDPAKENRIQVKLPVLNSDTDTVWARFANIYGTASKSGILFLPEVDDEVILGFLNSDPRHPVILGSLYSSKNAPPTEITADNNTKTIITKTKLTIEFDEDKKVITIKTPGKNQIEINDDKKSIKLTDQNKNTFSLDDKGITIDSGKDVIIKAKQNIKLTATSNIETKSTGDTKIKGMNVSGTADIGMTMKGSATAEFSASGQTTIKGAMVNIN